MSPVAVVTGAASGIGLAAVERLTQRGYVVAAIDVGKDALGALEQRFGRSVHPHQTDVRDAAAVAQVIAGIETELGPIAHVLCSAGIARVGPTLKVDRGDIDLMMAVNYGGVVNMVAACLPRMIDRGSGEFAVLASITGVTPPVKMAGYGATKAAVVSYLGSLRYEVAGTGVKLACVCPAAVSTPMAQDFFKDPANRAKSMATTPQKVVSSIENGLARGTFMIYPTALARAFGYAQRLSPGLVRAAQSSRFGDLV